jgi:hypothetical protein
MRIWTLWASLSTLAEGYNYFFTVTDQSTRWVEAGPIKNQEASTCADAFVAVWISQFGVPDHVTSDRENQSCSST